MTTKKKSRKASKPKQSDEAIAAFADLGEEGAMQLEAVVHPGITVVTTVRADDLMADSGSYWDKDLVNAIRKGQAKLEAVAAPLREAIQPLLSATLPPVSAEDQAAMGPSPERVSMDKRNLDALVRERDRYKRALIWYGDPEKVSQQSGLPAGRARRLGRKATHALSKEGRR